MNNPTPQEIEVSSIRAYGPSCYGCQRHGKHIMVSFSRPEDKPTNAVTDLFLTRDQGQQLLDELTEQMAE